MPINFSSLLSSKLICSVFGHPVDIPVSNPSPGIMSALRAPSESVLTVVSVKCVRVNDACLSFSSLLILPGAGEQVTDADKCCCNEKGLLVWRVLPETLIPVIHVGTTSLSQLVKAKRSGKTGASVTIGNVRLNGSVLSADIRAYWSENILGLEIVLIDQTLPINFDFGVQNPYEWHIADIEGPFGIPVSVDGKVSVTLDPNRVCAELRASWPGGNAQGPNGCVNF